MPSSIAFLVLLFFIAGGQFLLEALHIPMPSFQLAGSIVLLLFGLKMVLGKVTEEAAAIPAGASLARTGDLSAGHSRHRRRRRHADRRAADRQQHPHFQGAGDHDRRAGAVPRAAVRRYALAGFLFRLLGRAGIEIVSRVFGLILASIAVNGLIIAIKLSFGTCRLGTGGPTSSEPNRSRCRPGSRRRPCRAAAGWRRSPLNTGLPSSETSKLLPFRTTRARATGRSRLGTSLLAISARRPPCMR